MAVNVVCKPLVSSTQQYMMGGMMTLMTLWFEVDCASSCSSLLRNLWYLAACSAAAAITKRIMEKEKLNEAQMANVSIEVDVVRKREEANAPSQKGLVAGLKQITFVS